jgi:hypothetical protein
MRLVRLVIELIDLAEIWTGQREPYHSRISAGPRPGTSHAPGLPPPLTGPAKVQDRLIYSRHTGFMQAWYRAP